MLIILASVVTPSFWSLLALMLLFGWTWPVGVVRAEFLRARNFEYVRAARALGVRDSAIMFRHLLPNAMVTMLTFRPFPLGGSVTILTALDFSASACPRGRLHDKGNLQAPWLWHQAIRNGAK